MKHLNTLKTKRDKLVGEVEILVSDYDKLQLTSDEQTTLLVEIINRRNQIRDIQDEIIELIKQDLPKSSFR